VHELARGLLDFLLPPVCLACDRLIAAGDASRLVCRRCRSLLRPPPSPICQRCGAPSLRTGRAATEMCGLCESWPAHITHARTAFLLQPPADRIVHQLKYRGWHCLGAVVGETLARVEMPAAMRESNAVIAVPTTRSRIRERGYNQAGLIAESFARQTQRSLVHWLERAGSASSQTTLQPAKRAANVAGAFRLRPGSEDRVKNARILLIDDVLTTGATVSECAGTLADAGAASISVLTFARALDTQRL
jgi:ComF family protein